MTVIPTPNSHQHNPAIEQIESLIQAVRAEVGNAGFAAAVGDHALADEALAEAARHIEEVRTTLAARP